MAINVNEHGDGRTYVGGTILALVSSQYTDEESNSEQYDPVFVPHVHIPPPFYAEIVDGYKPPMVIIKQFRRSMIRSNGEVKSLSDELTELNDKQAFVY